MTVSKSLYPPQTKFGGVYRNHPVCLSVCPSVRLSVQSKLNLGYNFSTNRDKAFILHMLVHCDKTFLSVPKNLTLWPWPWLLTYFWKNLTLAIIFEPKKIRLSYYTCWFLLKRPFCPYQKNWPVTLTLTFDLLLKKLNLGYNFWTKRDKAFILQVCIPCGKTFLSIPKILTLWPWPWLLTYFWKKFNLGYNFWTKRDKAFIVQVCIPCGMTFLSIPKFWPCDLDLDFWPTFEKT